MFSMDKFSFYKNAKWDIIAVTSYNGKLYKGKAKCHPNDKYDEAIGREIAALRAEAKVWKCRDIKAQNALNDAVTKYNKACRDLQSAHKYFSDTVAEGNEIFQRLGELNAEP